MLSIKNRLVILPGLVSSSSVAVRAADVNDRRHQAISFTSAARTATEEEETRPGKTTQAYS